MNAKILQRSGRILLLGVVVIAIFAAIFAAFLFGGKWIGVQIDTPKLIAIMPVPATKMIGVSQNDTGDSDFFETLHVMANNGKIYNCPLTYDIRNEVARTCILGQLPDWEIPRETPFPGEFVSTQSIIPDPVIDVIYYGDGGSRIWSNNQISLTANGQLWEQGVTSDEYQTDNVLFCLYPFGVIVSLIVAIMIALGVNRVLNRRQQLNSPVIDQSVIDTPP